MTLLNHRCDCDTAQVSDLAKDVSIFVTRFKRPILSFIDFFSVFLFHYSLAFFIPFLLLDFGMICSSLASF